MSQKIKVNNGTELVTKAKEYKNSEGEWKLRERYIEMATGAIGKRKNKLGWGIVISDGKQTIDIRSAGNNVNGRSGANDEINNRNKLEQIFPEAHGALFVNGLNEDGTRNSKYPQSLLDTSTYKTTKEAEGGFNLYRYLHAENSRHLKQILRDYVRENETKIYQSSNPHFSGWVEIVDGQEGNVYLYVGEKNTNDGREIKIGIPKSEFEKYDSKEYTVREILPLNWNIFTIDRPRIPIEEKDYYYKALSVNGDYWKTLHSNFSKTCRFMLEEARRLFEKRISFLEKELNSELKNIEVVSTKWMLVAIDSKLEKMKKDFPNWYKNYDKHCSQCGNRMCCDKEEHICHQAHQNQGLFHFLGEDDYPIQTPPSPTPKSSQISETEKKQLLQFFLTHNISKITLENGQLKVKYAQKEYSEVDSRELEKYRDLLKNKTDHSLSLNDLQTSSNFSQTNNSNNNNYLVLGITSGTGIAFVIGGVIYCWNRKKKRV